MGNPHEKKYRNYFRVTTITTNNTVKCRRNVNFEEKNTERSTGKNDGFWLQWGIFKEYIKQSIIMVVLKKPRCHLV